MIVAELILEIQKFPPETQLPEQAKESLEYVLRCLALSSCGIPPIPKSKSDSFDNQSLGLELRVTRLEQWVRDHERNR